MSVCGGVPRLASALARVIFSENKIGAAAAGAPMQALPDDVTALVLEHVPQVPDWGACAAVCARWRSIVQSRRTVVRLRLERAASHWLADGLLALEQAELPCARLEVSGLGDLDASEMRRLVRAVARSASSLECLQLAGTVGHWPKLSVTGEGDDCAPAALEAMARAPRLSLRELDLGWSSALLHESIHAVHALLTRSVPGDAVLTSLRLDGCRCARARRAGIRSRADHSVTRRKTRARGAAGASAHYSRATRSIRALHTSPRSPSPLATTASSPRRSPPSAPAAHLSHRSI